MQNFIEGFLLGGGLIIAIGAQNAFLLRQGLLKAHLFPLVMFCSASDALLMCLGVLGVGALISNNIYALAGMTFLGIVFLFSYGCLALWRAYRGGGALQEAGGKSAGLRATMLTAFALTYLNPHVYLDTVVIFGSLSADLNWGARLYFLAGGASSSLVWFVLLGYGARLLKPLFAQAVTWRFLDLGIAGIMFWIAYGLGVYGFDLWLGLG